MNKAEYAALHDGEWRHSLSINNSFDIEVYGLRLIESGGDGVYISGDTWYGDQLYSENIILKDLWCEKHYRQGISVISAQHLFVKNCWFINTSGTLPMSGVDLEPFEIFHRMTDVVFEKCRFTGNYGNGIQLSFSFLTSASIPVDVTFRDCYSSSNHDVSNTYSTAEIVVSASDRDAVTGKVIFDRCLVEKSKWTAVYNRKPADSYTATFNNCVFLDVSQEVPNEFNTPIWIEVTDYYNPCPRFGGIEFNDCLLSYSSNLNFLGSYGEITTSPGMGNVILNNLTVIHPDPDVTYNATEGGGSPDATCVFDFKKFTSTPATSMAFTTQARIVECSEQNSVLESIRTSDNYTFPEAVSYSVGGNAGPGEDYSRMNGFMIIPASLTSQRDTIFVLKDDYVEDPKSIIVTVNKSSLFTSSSLPMYIFAWDCITGIDDMPGDFKVVAYPNPAGDYLKVVFPSGYAGLLQIINERGQLVQSQEVVDGDNILDTNGLEKGIYFIRFQINNKIKVQKIIKL